MQAANVLNFLWGHRPVASQLIQPIQLNLQPKDNQTELIVQVSWRTDLAGSDQNNSKKLPKSVQERFLRSVSVQVNGKIAIEAQVGVSVADFPRFSFMFASVQVGDRFLVSCSDDLGKELTAEVLATA